MCLVIAVLEEVPYLSSTICNEFIELMAKKVLKHHLLCENREVLGDKDQLHMDQLTFIVRFVDLQW